MSGIWLPAKWSPVLIEPSSGGKVSSHSCQSGKLFIHPIDAAGPLANFPHPLLPFPSMKHLLIEPLESRIAPATLAINSVSLTEGDSGDKDFTFTVTLSDPPASGDVTVNFKTVDGTAIDGVGDAVDAVADYTALTGTLTFAQGTTTQNITIKVKGDVVSENDETFSVLLEMPSAGTTITTDTGTGTIQNDGKLSINSLSQFEGNTGLTPYAFTVTLTEGPLVGDVTVGYQTQDGVTDATSDAATLANNDYVQILPSTLLFTAGTTTQTIAAQVVGDTVQEKLENFRVLLQNPVGATVTGTGFGIGEIRNDPLRVSSVTQVEGNAGVTNMVFQVELSDYAGGYPVRVTYSTPSSTAVAGQDFSSTAGTLTFAEGETLKTISVPIYGDSVAESNEVFTLQTVATFAAPTGGGAVLAPFTTTGAGTILNDEITVGFSTLNRTLAEGNVGTIAATFTVNVTGTHSGPVTVHYRTINGTGVRGAVGGSDFTAVTDGTLVFQPGESSRNLTINYLSDTTPELTEDFQVEIFQVDAPGLGTTITSPLATGVIRNDDASVSITADAAATEGNLGTKQFGFTVTLNNPLPADTVFQYSTKDGTAKDGIGDAVGVVSDYVPVTAGSVTILAGQTTARLFVAVRGDFTKEGDETFSVELADPPLDTLLGTKLATATITEDDPGVSIGDVTIVEGNGGTNTALFTITLSEAPSATQTVTVDFTTADGTARSAAERQDYLGQTGTVTFAAGQTVKTVAVQVVGDLRYEADETFFVNLTAATLTTTTPAPVPTDPPVVTMAPYSIHDGQGLGTIRDTALGVPLDPRPTLAITSAGGVAENGPSGAIFTVTLSAVADDTVTVNYATVAGTAVVGDFAAQAGTLTFAPGEISKEITVVVNGDTTLEADEAFQVQLSAGSIAVGGGQTVTLAPASASATILNDDSSVAFFGPAPTFTEGGTGTMDFIVRLTGGNTVPVVVNYTTREAGSGAGFAKAGSDFTTKTGTLTFAVGETEKTISVAVLNDLVDEDNQTFEVLLSSVTNATGAGAVAVGTIVDNDAAPTVQIAPTLSITEGDTNSTAGFVVTLSAASDKEITVKYATAPGTAASPADFTAVALTTLTFAAGETSKSLPVTIIGDTRDEANEAFTVTLSEPSATVNLGNAISTGTIVDNDATPILSIADVSGLESAGPFSFKVRLSAASGLPVSVTYNTLNGTATAGTDFTTATGLLTIAPGDLEGMISVPITSDTTDELAEKFQVRLSAPANASILAADATGTILTDDNTFSIQSVTVAEEGPGDIAQTATLRVSRTGTLAASVQYATVNGTASAAGARPDFTAKSGTLTFAAGETFKDITVAITKDANYEFDENFTVALSNAVDGTVASEPAGTGTVTITNNDVAPTLSLEASTATEGVGAGQIFFRALLTAANEREEPTVQFETIDGTAVSSGIFKDFTALASELRFPIGSTAQNIVLNVTQDTIDEDTQTFLVRLKNPNLVAFTGGGATTTAIGTIVDNDPAPGLSVSDVSIGENESGAEGKVFTVSLSSESERTVTVNVSTVDGTARAGLDYTAIPATLLTFAPGEKTKTVFVPVLDDPLDEAAETFEVVLATPTNATLADARGLGTIPANDASQQPVVSINDVSVIEGDTLGEVLFTVSLSQASGRAVTVNFQTADGTAKASGPFADYIARTGTVTFAAGETSKTISIPILGDIFREGVAQFADADTDYTLADEKFTVVLSTPTNATINDGLGEAVIGNGNDSVVGVVVSDVAVVEGATGTRNATFAFQLSSPSVGAVTLSAATRNGTAIAGSDFSGLSQTVTFAGDTTVPDTINGMEVQKNRPGTTTASFTVTVGGDGVFESTESFFVDVLNVSGNVAIVGADVIGRLAARGTIFNDDFQVLNGGQTIQYVDVDGDLVTVSTTRGRLDGSQLTFVAGGTVGGLQLQQVNLLGNLNSYAGASISITADPQPGFDGVTDGRVNVGQISAAVRQGDQLQFTGVDLGIVTVEGDLGRIIVGDSFSTPALRTLDVISLGALGTTTGASSFQSDVLGPIGKVHVHDTLEGILLVVGRNFGNIGKLEVDGAIKGGASANSGFVRVTGRIDSVVIGDLIGGAGVNSGRIEGDPSTIGSSIGKVTIKGSVVGGSGEGSGVITASKIGNVTVGAITGGAGELAGAIRTTGEIGKVHVLRDVTGGAGVTSGAIVVQTKGGAITIDGDLIGGTRDNSGTIVTFGSIASVTVGGAVVGGSPATTAANDTATNAGSIVGNVGTATSIGFVVVKGAVTGGAGASSGRIAAGRLGEVSVGSLNGGSGVNSGSIFSNTSLGKVEVAHDVVGGNSVVGSTTATANSSGTINALQTTASVKVGGHVLGGTGANSGGIAGGNAGSISIVGSVAGGAGVNSGAIVFLADVKSLAIGKNTQGDSLKGGAGVQSGRVSITGDLASGALSGNIRGGTSDLTGGFIVSGDLKKLDIGGSIIGGDSATGTVRVNTGYLQAGLLVKGTIDGSVTAGTNGGVSLANSGVIRTGRIQDLTIGGNVTGNANVAAVISAAATIDTNNVGIAKLLIKGNADFAEILSGYGGVTTSGFRGQLTSADAQIGTVEIRGSTHSTNIIAGAAAGTGGRFGDATDVIASGIGVRNGASVISQIASVILKGSVLANADTFGIVAQHLLSVKLGAAGTPLAGLTKGPGNDTATPLPDASDEIGAAGSKFRAVELAV